MEYNAITDVAILGGSIIALAVAIIILNQPRKPARYHMIDQAKRWGK